MTLHYVSLRFKDPQQRKGVQFPRPSCPWMIGGMTWLALLAVTLLVWLIHDAAEIKERLPRGGDPDGPGESTRG